HGTPATIAAAIDAVRKRLAPKAPFFVTLGSQRDPRFGTGRLIAPGAFVTLDGSEAGVAHSYFDEAGVRKLFAGFTLDDVRETDASEIVGRWAHSERETAGIVHWWVRARRAQ
ncbi:MAG: hypothetical protein IAI50_19930, partial [Candidatus Eremiobacteraeota bacterium]|nr:hypothetical protein [Candidatus Eremiobacteraeota bacterium]